MRRTLGATGVLFASGFLPLPPSGGQGGEKRGDRKRGEGFFQGERESNEGVWKWERREELEGEAKSR